MRRFSLEIPLSHLFLIRIAEVNRSWTERIVTDDSMN